LGHSKGTSCRTPLAKILDPPLNISAAFDGVDHTTLTDRAHTVFGIHDVALDWLWSFITEQTQQIAVGSEKSVMFPSRFRTDPF